MNYKIIGNISLGHLFVGAIFALAVFSFTAIPAHAQYYDSYDYGYDGYSYDTYDYGSSYDSYDYGSSYDTYDYGYDGYNYDSYDYGSNYDTYDYGSSYDYGYNTYDAGYDYGGSYNSYSSYSAPVRSYSYVSPSVSYYYPTVTYSRPVTYSTPSYVAPAPRPPLQVSCYANSSSARVGSTVQWVASVSGGNGSYSHVWSGTDGLSGSGSSISIVYANTGTKTASVTVTSDGQSVSRSCNNSVNVYQDTVYYPPYNPPQYYPPLVVSCSANTTFAPVGTQVTWSANVSGGNGSYTYNWSGADNLYGYAQSIYRAYSSTGQKFASVTVHSDGQTITRNCSNNVTVGVRTVVAVAPRSLDIGCFVDPTNLRVNQPVTWSAEVTGGSAPYTYSWSGSDGLTGNQRTVTKYYGTTGDKSAVVSITSADGKSGTQACSNAATVRAPSSTATVTAVRSSTQTTATVAQNSNQLVASPIFAFPNIPWCWIALFVIIILIITVIYLLINRNKI